MKEHLSNVYFTEIKSTIKNRKDCVIVFYTILAIFPKGTCPSRKNIFVCHPPYSCPLSTCRTTRSVMRSTPLGS